LTLACLEDSREFFVVNETVTAAVVMLKYKFEVSLIHDNTDLFNRAEELIEIHGSFILDIKKLKTTGEESRFFLGRWALILDFSLKISVKLSENFLELLIHILFVDGLYVNSFVTNGYVMYVRKFI